MKHLFFIIFSIITIINLHAAEINTQAPLPAIIESTYFKVILEQLKNGNFKVDAPVDYYKKPLFIMHVNLIIQRQQEN